MEAGHVGGIHSMARMVPFILNSHNPGLELLGNVIFIHHPFNHYVGIVLSFDTFFVGHISQFWELAQIILQNSYEKFSPAANKVFSSYSISLTLLSNY